MADLVPPSSQALRDALLLSEEILRNIELAEIPLANAALKASRLARLLNDHDSQRIIEYEASGYPLTPGGLHPEIYRLAVAAGRQFQRKNSVSGVFENVVYTNSIEELESEVLGAGAALAAARDPDVSVSSSNPHQTVWNPNGNKFERDAIRSNCALAQRRLSSRRSFLYSYVLKRHHELRFSGIAEDIFSRIREKVDAAIGDRVPDATRKFTAVYENLQSDNPEDWANAVHSCRRILQDLADSLYPSRADVSKEINGKVKIIRLGNDNYINRIIAYVEEKLTSDRYIQLVGSHLGFLGDRLDSVFRAAQKGSHDFVSKEEADRYVVYTYMVVGDILTL